MLINDIVKVKKTTVECDGNDDGDGHPLVYLNLWTNGEAVCPYCSRKFVLDNKNAIIKQ